MEDNLTHKQLAQTYFNEVWNLLEIDNSERSPLENENMIHMAHASFYLWTQVHDHTEINISIGYWQLSRVYAVLTYGEQALYYAKRCLEVSESGNLQPFYIAYAYEALARAYKALEKKDELSMALQQAHHYTDQVENKDEQKYLIDDLSSL
jgi:hypothetical protein